MCLALYSVHFVIGQRITISRNYVPLQINITKHATHTPCTFCMHFVRATARKSKLPHSLLPRPRGQYHSLCFDGEIFRMQICKHKKCRHVCVNRWNACKTMKKELVWFDAFCCYCILLSMTTEILCIIKHTYFLVAAVAVVGDGNASHLCRMLLARFHCPPPSVRNLLRPASDTQIFLDCI